MQHKSMRNSWTRNYSRRETGSGIVQSAALYLADSYPDARNVIYHPHPAHPVREALKILDALNTLIQRGKSE